MKVSIVVHDKHSGSGGKRMRSARSSLAMYKIQSQPGLRGQMSNDN